MLCERESGEREWGKEKEKEQRWRARVRKEKTDNSLSL